MKPPSDLPLELVLLAEAFARRLGVPEQDFWAIVYRKQDAPPGWSAAWAEAFAPLTSVTDSATNRYTMQLPEIERGARPANRRPDTDHPFPAWLVSINVTVTEWAAANKDPETRKPYTRERVKSWYATGSGARAIPRHAADLIAQQSTDEKTGKVAVPATRRSWRNGIRE